MSNMFSRPECRREKQGLRVGTRDSFSRGEGAREARRRLRPSTPNIARTEARRVPASRDVYDRAAADVDADAAI